MFGCLQMMRGNIPDEVMKSVQIGLARKGIVSVIIARELIIEFNFVVFRGFKQKQRDKKRAWTITERFVTE